MKKVLKSILALALCTAMVLGSVCFEGIDFPSLRASAAVEYSSNTVDFGSYPQRLVTEDDLLSQLNAKSKNWKYFDYYSGNGSYGSMSSGKYMMYADVYLGEYKYRAITFTQYRPNTSCGVSDVANTYQDQNSYHPGEIYWFSYAPIEWYIVDAGLGILMSTSILDAQPYSNFIYWADSDADGIKDKNEVFNNSSCTTYANDYASSSIREWLNDDFYNTAFSSEEKKELKTVTLNNETYIGANSEYSSKETKDKVFLLSHFEVSSDGYGLESGVWTKAMGTSYARCQGLFTGDKGLIGGYSHWWLRTAGSTSYTAANVHATHLVHSDGVSVNNTYMGVRPAIKVELEYVPPEISDELEETPNHNGPYVFTLVDRLTGKLLSEFDFTLNGQIKTSKANGEVEVTSSELNDKNYLCVEGYHDYIFDRKVIDNNIEPIYLETTKSYSKPYISSVYCKKSEPLKTWKNLACEKVYFSTTNSQRYDIIINAQPGINGSPIASYVLSQDGAHSINSPTGYFSSELLAKSFTGHKPIVAYCIDSDGEISNAYDTSFEVYDSSLLKPIVRDTGIKLFDDEGISFTISEGVPILGGSEFKFKVGDLFPISFQREGFKYRMVVGLEKEYFEDIDIFDKDNWNSIKQVSNAYKSHVYLVDKKSQLIELRTKKMKGQFLGSWVPEISAMGYIEAELVNGTFVVTETFIGLKFKLEQSYAQPVYAPPPVYVELEVNLQAHSGANAKKVVADNELPFDIDFIFKLDPVLYATAGVGIPKVLSIDAGGKITLDYYLEVANRYHKFDVIPALFIRARLFLCDVFNIDVAKETFHIVDGTYGSPPDPSSLSTQSLDEPIDYFDPANYTEIASRDYLENSQWIGGISPYSYSRTRGISVKGYEASTLMSSIYNDSRQQLINLDNGNKLLVFITDNASRSNENRTMLAYSLYDTETGVWSEPAAVSDDGTADFYPDVASDGENVWVAWQNSNTTFTSETATLENYSTASEICVAKFNAEAGSFETASAVTSDAKLDTTPAIACENGDIRVAWISNSENDIFGYNGKNSIMTSNFDGNSWSESKQLKSDVPAINSIDAAVDNGKFYVAYACDENNDYNDVNDIEIYRITDNGSSVSETRITENEVLDSAPKFGIINGETKLVWYSENNLYTLTNLDGTETETIFAKATNVTDSFVIADSDIGTNYIIWSQNVGEHVAFFAAVYDGEQWSNPVLIGESSGKAINPTATVNDDGTIMIAYNNVAQELITVPGEDGEEDFTYYKDAQTALAVLNVYQNANVTVTDSSTEIECEQAVPGNEVPLTVTVTNSSISALKSIDVYIDETLNSTVAVDLLPGESQDITVNYTMPETIVQKEIEIKVLPSNTDDFDLNDNTVTTEYGYTELSVNNIMITDSQSHKHICATIDNESEVDSGKFNIRIREDAKDGNIIHEETISNLAAGKSRYIGFTVDKSSVEYDENGMKIYYVEVEPENQEYLTGNNSDYVTFVNEDSNGADAQILRVDALQETADVYGVVENNEYSNNTVYAKVEIFDADGNAIGLSVDRIDLASRGIHTYEKSIDIYGEYYEAKITLIDEKDIVNVSGVSLNTTETSVYLTHQKKLDATITPSNATDPSIVWISSDESVATVNGAGVISALSVGSAIITAITNDGEYKANCTVTVIPNDFTITWIVDDEESQTIVTEGNPITAPETPQKVGYNFEGWSPQVPETMPAENLTFTATWTPITCEAVFDADGGKWQDGESTKTVSVDYDSQIAAPDAPEKQGYIFAGWLLDGENIGTDAGIMDNPDGKLFTASWIASDETYYTVETYTMTPYGEYIKSVKLLQGITDELVSFNPEIKIGFILNEEKSILSGSISADNSLVLKAYADRQTFTFTTVVDGVSSSLDYYFGAMVAQPKTPLKTGYIFTGWSEKIPATMPAENIELTAEFELVEYKAVFVADGNEVACVPYTVESKSVEIPDVPQKQGYSAAWEDFAFELGGIRVNAVYTPNTYKITWKADFVTVETEIKYGQEIIAPDIPEKAGYVFTGWDKTVPESMPAEDLIFIAVYEKTGSDKFICPNCGSEFDSEETLNAHVAQENRPSDINLTIKTPSTQKINYGETLIMHANVSNLPEGAKLVWEASGSGVEIEPAKDGKTCNVTSVSSGEATVTVKAVDTNGNVIKNSDGTAVSYSQNITSKAGLWQKIVSFFKNLFRINRVIPQAFLK